MPGQEIYDPVLGDSILNPVDVCNVSIGARTPRQASEICSRKTCRLSVEDRGFPTWNGI